MSETGFWLKVFMGNEKHPEAESYMYFKHDDGYSEKDEESLKSIAEDWAQNDQNGWTREHYRYGFDVVTSPPVEWLSKRLNEIRGMQEELIAEETFIKSEYYKLIGQKTEQKTDT